MKSVTSSMRSGRPDFDFYFIGIAEAVAARADCRRRAVGAVLVDVEQHIISTGYNGTRPGSAGCLEGACPRGLLSYDRVGEFTDYNDPGSPGFCISTHAEMNAMLHAGAPLKGCTMYVTCDPCPGCLKAIGNSGIVRLVVNAGEGRLLRTHLT